ncbi:hypothetical protein M9435_003971 [Picochlorum sp. BPE23]|nr:hypothetical protein M9435_003971 [Picochlorum sp. BPE23]
MPKGGPLAFLNKKHWHPGRLQNQEKVWKKEQEAAKEQQKLEDLRKQIEEERAKEELNAMAAAAGVKVREEKLDWMYQGGVGAMHDANQREEQKGHEDHAAGTQEQIAGAGGERDASRPSLPSFYEQDNPSSANEIWQRLHGDPLMIMKQQELQARRSIVSNPVKMDAIKKRAKEEKRKRYKSSRHHRHHRHGDEGEDGDDERRRRRRHRSSSRHRRHDSSSRRDEERAYRHEHRSSQRDASPVQHHLPTQREDPPHHGPRYGISFASNAPEAVRQKDRSSVIHDTQKRLEEAARKKEQEQREQAAQRHKKRVHTTGRLTEEERRRKLEQMSMSAKEFEQHRSERVSTYQNRSQAEEKALYDANRSSTRDFLRREALDRLHKT